MQLTIVVPDQSTSNYMTIVLHITFTRTHKHGVLYSKFQGHSNAGFQANVLVYGNAEVILPNFLAVKLPDNDNQGHQLTDIP